MAAAAAMSDMLQNGFIRKDCLWMPQHLLESPRPLPAMSDPLVMAALGDGHVEDTTFRRLSYEIAFSEYGTSGSAPVANGVELRLTCTCHVPASAGVRLGERGAKRFVQGLFPCARSD